MRLNEPRITPAVGVRAGVVVGRVAGEQVVGGDEHGVGGGGGFLVTAMLHDAPVARGEGPRGRLGSRSEGCLDEGAAEPPVAVPGPGRSVRAGTVVVAGAQAGPSWRDARPWRRRTCRRRARR